MKSHLPLILLNFLIGPTLCAQFITNVRAEQNGKDIIVFYDVLKLPYDHVVDVTLWVAVDGKNYEGPLRSVSGDVGQDITGGRGKRITWRVLEEYEQLIGDKIVFKVEGSLYDSKVIEMVYIEGGEFTMGSYKEYDEQPLHSVYVNDFFIGKYEITQRQWKRVMGGNPSFFDYCDACPVENVSWKDVEEFIVELNRQTNMNYRLPTEAEWEYAAKGGNKSLNHLFSGSDDPDRVAWYIGNNNQHTRKVGTKLPNEIGIYDMSGNVMEWCADWYSNIYYHDCPYKNPQGPLNGSHHVIKGGSWSTTSTYLRIANRSKSTNNSRYDDLGFRLARDVE